MSQFSFLKDPRYLLRAHSYFWIFATPIAIFGVSLLRFPFVVIATTVCLAGGCAYLERRSELQELHNASNPPIYRARNRDVRKLLALTFLALLVALALRIPASSYQRGGQDQGLYTAWAAHIERTGDLTAIDQICEQLPENLQEHLISQEYRPGEFAAGIVRNFDENSNNSCGKFNLDFFVGFPAVLALIKPLLGVSGAQTLMAMSLVIQIGYLSWLLTNSRFGYACGIMFAAVNPIMVTFAKWPVSETLTALVYASYATLIFPSKSGEQASFSSRLGVLIAALLSLSMIRLQTWAFIPLIFCLVTAGIGRAKQKVLMVFVGAVTMFISVTLSVDVSENYLRLHIPRTLSFLEKIVSVGHPLWPLLVSVTFALIFLISLVILQIISRVYHLAKVRYIAASGAVAILAYWTLVSVSNFTLGPDRPGSIWTIFIENRDITIFLKIAPVLLLFSFGIFTPLICLLKLAAPKLYSSVNADSNKAVLSNSSFSAFGLMLSVGYAGFVFSRFLYDVRYTPYFERYLLPEMVLLLLLLQVFVLTGLSEKADDKSSKSSLRNTLRKKYRSMSKRNWTPKSSSSVTPRASCLAGLGVALSLLLSLQQFGRAELRGLDEDLATLVTGLGEEDVAVMVGTRTWSWLNRPVVHFHLGVPTILLSSLEGNEEIIDRLLSTSSTIRVFSQYEDGAVNSGQCSLTGPPVKTVLSFSSFIKNSSFASEMEDKSETLWSTDIEYCRNDR